MELIEISPQIPFLLQLPNELLHQIFNECNILESPICKDLLPFTRAPIFKRINLKSLESFKLFIKTILQYPSSGRLVTELDVTIISNVIPDTEDLALANVVLAFSHLNRLWRLKLNWEYLAHILSSYLAKFLLPQLEDLTLVDPYRSNENPWCIVPFINLWKYMKLDCLQLTSVEGNQLNKHESSIFIKLTIELYGLMDRADLLTVFEMEEQLQVHQDRNLEPESTDAAATISASVGSDPARSGINRTSSNGSTNSVTSEEEADIEELDIDVCLDDPELLETIQCFNLTILRISEAAIGVNLITLLEEIHPHLFELHIYYDSNKEYSLIPSSNTALYPTITRFKDLEELTVSAKVFTNDIFRYLRDPLPLRILTLDYETNVRISDLKLLITPGSASHLSTLKTLNLESVFASISDDRVETLGPYFDPDDGEATAHPGWYLADWTDEFDSEDVEDLVSLGKKYDVEVTGDSVEAAEVENLYNFDVELAQELAEEMSNSDDPEEESEEDSEDESEEESDEEDSD